MKYYVRAVTSPKGWEIFKDVTIYEVVHVDHPEWVAHLFETEEEARSTCSFMNKTITQPDVPIKYLLNDMSKKFLQVFG